jgi:hypothetical protein
MNFINTNIRGEEISNINCSKCKRNKTKVDQDIKEAEKYYNFINNYHIFKNEKEKSEDKMLFLNSLYGKGLFNFEKSISK